MLSKCAQNIGAGDLVIISPEYEHFYGTYDGSMTLAELVLWVPESVKYLTPLQLATLPLHYVELLRNKPCYWMLTCRKLYRQYIKHERTKDENGNPIFNNFGDEVGHLQKRPKGFSSGILTNQTRMDDKAIDHLSEFNKLVAARNAKLIVSLPYIEKCVYHERKLQIEGLNSGLRRVGITVLREPDNSVFDSEAFYDTSYHLTGAYRAIRTRQLISDISHVDHCKFVIAERARAR